MVHPLIWYAFSKRRQTFVLEKSKRQAVIHFAAFIFLTFAVTEQSNTIGRVRVIKKERPLSLTKTPEPLALAPDSLAQALVCSAQVIAKVRGKKSLTEARLCLHHAPEASRAASQDIAYGVLRAYGQGEFILSQLLTKTPPSEEIYALLLAALYRLKTRADQPAMVVDQAVFAAKAIAGAAFDKLVNGVLRNYLRQKEKLLVAMEKNEAARLSHPAWWIARLQKAYPQEWMTLITIGNRPPPMCLRANLQKTTQQAYLGKLTALGIASDPLGKAGLLLKKPVGVVHLPDFLEGAISIQDFGAQRAAELLSLSKGMKVLDACAAPGGKAAHLLEREAIDLLALDIDAIRCERIRENFARLHLSAKVLCADASTPETWWDKTPFDAILADVPCSASGVVRRHPDIKTLRRPSDIHQFAKTQTLITDALWECLKVGGQFLYATCSVFPEENEGQIAAFLIRHKNAKSLLSEKWLPNEKHDGFYYHLLQKG